MDEYSSKINDYLINIMYNFPIEYFPFDHEKSHL